MTNPNPARHLHQLLKNQNAAAGRFLDIGCSTGKLIYHMQMLGYTVAGCDVNAEAVDIAVNHGLDARVGTVEALD